MYKSNKLPRTVNQLFKNFQVDKWIINLTKRKEVTERWTYYLQGNATPKRASEN